MRKTSFLKKIIFIVIAIGTITSGIFVVRAVNNRGNAPVAWWKMDEGQGQTTYNASGNGNNGTLGASTSDTTPDPTWKNEESCKNGKCLQFDGADDYVSGNTTGFSYTTGTIEMWVYPTSVADKYLFIFGSYSTNMVAIDSDESGANNFSLHLRNGTSNLVTGYVPFTLNSWQHVVGVYTATTVQLYINGILMASSVGTNPNTALGTTYYIGRYSTSGYYFGGTIDDVRVYNYARSANQIKADYNKSAGGKGAGVKVGSSQEEQNASDGLVGYWKMDEASWVADSAVVLDSSGNGYNGTPKNHATSTATAKFGRAGTFDGTDDYVNISPVISSVASATAGTMSFWFKPTLLKDYEDLIGFSAYIGGQNRQIRVTANAAGTLFGITYDDAQKWTIESNSPVFTVGTWTFVTLVQDGTAPVFYVNGKLIPITFTQSVDKTFWFADTTFDTALIGSLSYADYTQGQIDDVKIYNKARSAEQIQRDYESGPPPVAHWRMDENTGQYANDTSGTNNGTLGTGATADASDPTWTNGKYGSAPQFDGSDDYISSPNTTSINFTSNFTVSAWVQSTKNDATYYQGIVGKANLMGDEFGWFLSKRTDNKFYFQVRHATYTRSDVTTYSNIVYTDNSWHHLTGVVSSSGAQYLYVDGVMQTAYSASGANPASAQPVVIGTSYGDVPTYIGYNERFKGIIDDVRVYNYARTQKQIMEDMNVGHPAVGSPVGSYVGYWNFDEGQGDTAYDKSINKNNGDLYGSCPGAATCPTWTTAGKFGKALSFDGGDYVNLVDTSAFKLQQFSISAWFKVSDYSVSRPIFGNYNYNMYYGYAFYVGTDGKIYFHTATSVGGLLDQVISTNAVATGSWYHVVVTLDGSAIKMFVNGVYDNQDSSQQTLVYDTLHYPTIGRNTYRTAGGYQRFFSGLIDDVKIYPFALSPAEIKEEFNRGASLKLGALGTESDGTTPSNSALSAYCVPGDTTSCAAPVAHWKMDEKIDNTCSGGVNDVCDTSGNGNDGANTGGPVWKSAASCKSGSCLSFDGVNDYVVTTDVSVAGSAFTLSAWVFVSSYPSSYSRILCKAESGVDYPEYCLSVKNTGVIWLETTESAVGSNYSSMDTTNTITNNRWYHIVATNDKTTLRVYINGVADPTTGTGRTPYNNDDAMYIGAEKLNVSPYYTRLFNGLIDDVRIYNYARTPAQIAWDYNRGGPVASWSMDSVGVSASPGTALNVYDSSGKANTGVSSGETMNNGTITGATWKDGSNCKYGSCLSFDGSNNYVDAGGNTGSLDFTGTQAFSISAWVKPSALSNFNTIVGKNVADYQYNLFLGSDGKVYFGVGGSGEAITGASAVSTGSWYHIVAVSTGATTAIYVNGVVNATGTPLSMTHRDSNVFIGKFRPTGTLHLFNGIIDDVRVYNTALTATQVSALYNNNDRAAGASLEANLVGEWRFDEMGTSYVVDTHYQRIGKYGYAMNFDGSDDYVNAGSGSSIHPTKYITISVWVKPGSTQVTYADIAGNHAVDGGWNGYTIQQSGSTLNLFGFSYGNGSTWQGGTVLTQLVANQWNHYVVQKDDTVMRSYLNGVLVGQENVSGDIAYAVTHPIYIGVGYTGLTRYFNGLIDDVRIYNYVRSADQIKQDYNQGAAVRFGPLEGLP